MRFLEQDILILSQHFAPEPNFVTGDLAIELAKSSRVVVVTAHPNYPHGKFYSSVEALWPTKTVENGVSVWRLPFFPDHSKSKVKRLVSYLSFAVVAALWAPLTVRRPKVVFVYQTPFTMGLSALWFKYVMGSKLYYVCADLWPESFSAAGVAPAGVVMRLMYWYSRWINRRADFLVCSTKGTLERYFKDGVPRSKMAFVPVWVEGIPGKPLLLKKGKQASRKIVYAGNVGAAQGLEILVRAACICSERNIEVFFEVFGTGTEEQTLRRLVENSHLRNISFRGQVSPEEAFDAASSAMAVFVHLVSSPLFRMTLPSKLASAFASGGIVLAGVEGEAETWIQQSGAGFTFSPGNAEELVAKVETILRFSDSEAEGYHRRAISFYEQSYRKERLLAFYSQLFEMGTTTGLSE